MLFAVVFVTVMFGLLAAVCLNEGRVVVVAPTDRTGSDAFANV